MIIREILFVHEEEPAEWALQRVLDFADRVQARVTLAVAVPDASRDLVEAGSLDGAILEEISVEEKRHGVEELRSACGRSAAELPLTLLRGRAFRAVIREVIRNHYDLVAVAAPERDGIVQMILPSTAMHLLRKCPSPVWIMRPSQWPPRHIGVAVDAEAEGERQELDRSLVEAGDAFASAYAATLQVLHAMVLYPSESMLRARAGLADAEVSKIKMRATSRLERNLRELVTDRSARASTHVLEGRPSVEIPKYVVNRDLDLLIMGTVGRTGIAGLLMGNTAEEILQRVECSILALKPPGFVSPVA